MLVVSGPEFFLILAVLGAILMLVSIAPSPFQGGLRYVGLVFLIIGALAYLALLAFGL